VRRSALRLVNTETGEVHDGCPACSEAERTLVQYEKDIRILKAKITKLERDEEAECRTDPLWPEAEAVHEWWRLATGHLKTHFDAEDFKILRPHLKRGRHGVIDCLEAICGAAFDPYEKEKKNGRMKRYDDWDTIFATKAKMERFAERVPGEEGSQLWKTWLIQRIEGNLRLL